MRNASEKDGLDWMQAQGFRISDHRPNFTVVEHDKIPMDSGRRIHMVKEDLANYRGHEVLLHFAGWSVWPSGEWLPLFERLQSACDLEGKLSDRPSYFFEADEYDDMMNFVMLGVIFLWDLYVMSDDGRVVFYSHDETRDTGKRVSDGHANVT
jgi:hypothetical protein